MKGICKYYGEEFDCCKLLSDFSNPMTELRPCEETGCKYYTPITNYDKITESVESLAEFIEKYATNCHYCPLYKLEKCKLTGWKIESENCKKEIKEWLQKECDK